MKVCSVSIAAFRILLAIWPNLFGYQARILRFSFFNVSHKSLSFITLNCIEYLHTQSREQWYI